MFAKKQRLITRLLVVEDEPLVAFDNEHILTDQGYAIVATVDRVADALRVIAGGAEIDLVLVDVNLADGTGIDVAHAAQAKAIPVMFVTGTCPSEAEALAHGCLSKPYSQRDLVNAIAAIDARLGGRRPKRLPGGFRLFEVA